jgi:maleylpyruvate isomerase
MSGAAPRLHGYFSSSAAFRVRIALNLKGRDYQSVPHRLRQGEQRGEDFLRLNPQGFVPALETGGAVLCQSLAIIEYLDETIPRPPLLPPAALDRAYARSLAQIVCCDIHPVNNLRILQYLRGRLAADEAVVATWYNHWIAEGFTAFERIIAADRRTGLFCLGDAPGLADICLVPQVVNAGTYKLDMTPYPTISRVFDACLDLPAFKAAHPRAQPDAEQ